MGKFKNASLKAMLPIILCITVFVVILGVLTVNQYKMEHLLKTGIKTQATVIPDSYTSNFTKDDVKYYCIQYSFLDQNEVSHIGKTTSNYTYNEILAIEQNGVITIVYNPETFESVETGAVKYVQENKFLFYVFLSIDIVLCVAVVVMFIKAKNKQKVFNQGKEYTAQFIAYKSNLSINNQKIYDIMYEWTDENGQIKKDTSGHEYSFKQAHAFEELGTFKIKVIGNESVIVTEPTANKQIQFNETTYYTCKYCNSIFAKNNNKCPNCGANIEE